MLALELARVSLAQMSALELGGISAQALALELAEVNRRPLETPNDVRQIDAKKAEKMGVTP